MELDGKKVATLGLVSIASGVMSGMMGYGVYGTFREKGWQPFSAGAATGAIGGAVAAVALVLLAKYMPEEEMPAMAGFTMQPVRGMSGFTMQPVRGMRGLSVRELPRAMGMVTANKLAGLDVMMLH